MALYLPTAKLAVEIIDDPNCLPADLDAYPDYMVVPLTRSELTNPAARERAIERIACMAGASKTDGEMVDEDEHKRLLRLISSGLDLNHHGIAARGIYHH